MAEVINNTQDFVNKLSDAKAVVNQRLNGPNAYRVWLLATTPAEHESFMQALGKYGNQYSAQFMAFLNVEAQKPTLEKINETAIRLQNLIRQ